MLLKTTHIVKRNGVTISEKINDNSEYLKLVHGYKKLAPYGSERQEKYNDYLNSTDKLECLILGNYSNMGQFTETYYK